MTVDSPTAFSPLRLAEAWETDAEFRRAVSVAYQKHVDGRPRLKFANELYAHEMAKSRALFGAAVAEPEAVRTSWDIIHAAYREPVTVTTFTIPPRNPTDRMVAAAKRRVVDLSVMTLSEVWRVMWEVSQEQPSFLEVMENYYG